MSMTLLVLVKVPNNRFVGHHEYDDGISTSNNDRSTAVLSILFARLRIAKHFQ